MANANPFEDRVLGTTTDLENVSGNWTLASTTTGHLSLDTMMSVGDEKVVTAVGASGQWECFVTKKIASNSFSRTGDFVISSSSGSVVNFSAGTKEIFVGMPFSEVTARDKSDYLLNGHGVINDGASSLTDGVTGAHRAWLALTQTAAIGASTLSDVADGLDKMIRLSQSQAAAQRMGYAQIIRADRCKKLRGKRVSFGGVLRYSNAAAVRFAILEWTGTADAALRDVVNDWTSGTYTAGNFFISTTTTVRAVGTITPSAATVTDFRLTATLGSTLNNLILFVWTEGTAAQNSTLDIAVQLKRGAVVHPCVWRSPQEEMAQIITTLTTDTTLWVRTDGHDSNTGAADSAAGAFLTWPAAIAHAQANYNFNNKNMTIRAGGSGDRNFAPASTVNPILFSGTWIGGGRLHLLGDASNPGSVRLNATNCDAVLINSGAVIPGSIRVEGFRLQTTTAGYGIYHRGEGKVEFGNILCFGCVNGWFATNTSGALLEKMSSPATLEFDGDTSGTVFFADAGAIFLPGIATVTGAVDCSIVAEARYGGFLYSDITWTGTFNSGFRFVVDGTSAIRTLTNGRTHFPAPTAGTVAKGGSYYDASTTPVTALHGPDSNILAYNSATDTDVTGDGTLVTVDFDTEIRDQGSEFASDQFTATATGPHEIAGQIRLSGLVVATHSSLVEVVTSNRRYRVYNDTATKTAETVSLGSVGNADMDAGDTATVEVTCSGGTKVVDIIGAAGSTLFTWISVKYAG